MLDVFVGFVYGISNAKILVLSRRSAFLSAYIEITFFLFYQKQSSKGVLRKRCSENMQQIYKRTPLPNCDFKKVALQLY